MHILLVMNTPIDLEERKKKCIPGWYMVDAYGNDEKFIHSHKITAQTSCSRTWRHFPILLSLVTY